MSKFRETPQKFGQKICLEQKEFLEMQCYAAIGRFVKEFEFLISMIRNFLKPCLVNLGWKQDKINRNFANLPAGALIKLMKNYKNSFPKDPKGQTALENFVSVLEKVNEGRIQLLHGFHIGDFQRNSFITIKDWHRKKGQIEKVILQHTPKQLDRWEKVMAMLSEELWRAMKNVKSGKSIQKSLVTGNLAGFHLPELGTKNF